MLFVLFFLWSLQNFLAAPPSFPSSAKLESLFESIAKQNQHMRLLPSWAIEELPMAQTSETLLDLRYAMPQTASYPFEILAKVFRYSQSCLKQDSFDLQGSEDPRFNKLGQWVHFVCNDQVELSEAFFAKAPFMHPSGSSYEALYQKFLKVRQEKQGRPVKLNLLHAIELDSFPEGRAWLLDHIGSPRLSKQSLAALTEGQQVALNELNGRFIFVTQFLKESRRIQTFSFDEFRAELAAHGVCANSTSQAKVTFRNCGLLRSSSRSVAGSGMAFCVLALLAEGLLTFAQNLRQKKQVEERHLFLHKMLTHELRTPATGLHLSLVELGSEFDNMSPQGQQAFLRLQGSEARIKHVLDASKLYVTQGLTPKNLHAKTTVNLSCRNLLGIYDDDVPGEKTTHPKSNGSEDSEPLRFESELDEAAQADIDLFWFSFCLSNIVDNALKHGKTPVTVKAHDLKDEIAIRVHDQGTATFNSSGREAQNEYDFAESNRGLGLGLSLVRDVVKSFRGKLVLSVNPTVVTMTLKRSL